MLLNQIKILPKYKVPLTRVGVYTTDDQTMCLNMFMYGTPTGTPPQGAGQGGQDSPILDLANRVAGGEVEYNGVDMEACDPEEVKEYMTRCSPAYLNNSVSRRFLKQMSLYHKVAGTEGVAVAVEEFDPEEYSNDEVGRASTTTPMWWVDSAIANSLPQYALEYFARAMSVNDLNIVRCHLDNVEDGANGTVTQLRMLVSQSDPSGPPVDWARLKRNLKRQKWIDPSTSTLITSHPWLGIRRAEIVTALASLMHPIMSAHNPVAYSKANIFSCVTGPAAIERSGEVAAFFIDKFDPKSGAMSAAEQERRADELRSSIDSSIVDRASNELLHKMVDCVLSTLRTNLFLEDRYALSLRLDPGIMHGDDGRDTPYGVFFSHGRRFNGYHVRFRDISRGGMRLVTPQTSEQLAIESGLHYSECYGLSFAQQMKNKDIPEGGSKCVCLVDTVGMGAETKGFVMRKSVKAFSDSLLDLIVDSPEVREMGRCEHG